MTTQIEKIKRTIEPLRQEIINHKVYSAIKDLEDLKVFMQFHVYAVWDFMSLLKTLQGNLTCTSVPWFPKGTADSRYLINEIVVGEESDIDLNGVRKSHFELYLDAMKQCGADTSKIEAFTNILKNTGDFNSAYLSSETPKEAKDFVDFTFKVIESGKDYLQSAIFTFGREDLIPGMFVSIVNDIHKNFPDAISIFKYYLERHIEVDGDHHSHLALQMTSNLCGTDSQFWKEAEQATIESLYTRINLWDGAYREITNRISSRQKEIAPLSLPHNGR
jgi:pyrroloquinoline quinone (PQQ) biosynthesis protein C